MAKKEKRAWTVVCINDDCKTEFLTKRKNKSYCSRKCAVKKSVERFWLRKARKQIDAGEIGPDDARI